MLKSLLTTVETPSKCPGRLLPQRVSARARDTRTTVCASRPSGIDILYARRIKKLHALGKQLFPIRREGARVGVEILSRAELHAD
jgi:hypothetical protein